MSKIKVRTATVDDTAALCRISTEDLGYKCDEALVRKRIEELDHRREEVFIAEIDGEGAGYIHVDVFKTLYMEDMVNYLGVAVSSKFRRMGVGSAIIAAAEEWALGKGIYKVRLDSGEKRTGAHKFYEKLGYENDKMQKHFIKTLARDAVSLRSFV